MVPQRFFEGVSESKEPTTVLAAEKASSIIFLNVKRGMHLNASTPNILERHHLVGLDEIEELGKCVLSEPGRGLTHNALLPHRALCASASCGPVEIPETLGFPVSYFSYA